MINNIVNIHKYPKLYNARLISYISDNIILNSYLHRIKKIK